MRLTDEEKRELRRIAIMDPTEMAGYAPKFLDLLDEVEDLRAPKYLTPFGVLPVTVSSDVLPGHVHAIAAQSDEDAAREYAKTWLAKNDWDYQKYDDKRPDRSAYGTMMFYEITDVLEQCAEESYAAGVRHGRGG